MRQSRVRPLEPGVRRVKDGPTHRLLDVLLCFRYDTPRLSALEIAGKTQIPRSTTYRLLSHLVRRGFLALTDHAGTYTPGLKLLELGAIAGAQIELRQVARPVMVDLLAQTGETVNLSVHNDGHRICVEKLDSIHDIRGVIQVGQPYPLHAGAAGKAILAFLPGELVTQIITRKDLQAFTVRTQTERGSIQRALAEIRRDIVAVTHGERVEGATAVSAPVFDQNGNVLASLTISGPSFRFTPEKIGTYKTLVKAAAQRLTSLLGGRPPSTKGATPEVVRR